MADVEVAIEKLKAAGKDFDKMGAKLEKASTNAGQIDLSKEQMAYMGEELGIIDEYNKVQKFMVDILADGEKAMSSVGGALGKAAKDYKQDEEDGKHKVEDAGGN